MLDVIDATLDVGGDTVAGRESTSDSTSKQLRPQLSANSAETMFSAPGPMQTSTPGRHLPVTPVITEHTPSASG